MFVVIIIALTMHMNIAIIIAVTMHMNTIIIIAVTMHMNGTKLELLVNGTTMYINKYFT